MPRRARVDWDAVNAAAPLGLILVRDLLALGVPSSTIAARCRRAGGVWWRPLPGLVAPARGTLTRAQRLAAALLYAGDGAMVTGFAACALYGITRLPDDDRIHVLVDHGRRRRNAEFVLVERTKRMPAGRTRDDVLCAPVHRAVIDGARLLADIDDARALLGDAVQQRLTTVAALRAEVGRSCSSRGVAMVRSVVAELESGIRSAAEAWSRELVRTMVGFPDVRWNVDIRFPDGTFLACADGFVDSVGLVIEVQSFAHHSDPDAYDATMRRHAAMIAAGLVVVPVTPRQLQKDPQAVIRTLWAALEQARARPRPNFIVAPSAATRAA